jgi:hypothetical protein
MNLVDGAHAAICSYVLEFKYTYVHHVRNASQSIGIIEGSVVNIEFDFTFLFIPSLVLVTNFHNRVKTLYKGTPWLKGLIH